MEVCCLLLWYPYIVLMCVLRVSLVNLEIMCATVFTTSQECPPVPLFLGCWRQFFQFFTLPSVLDLLQPFYLHLLHPSQVLKSKEKPCQTVKILWSIVWNFFEAKIYSRKLKKIPYLVVGFRSGLDEYFSDTIIKNILIVVFSFHALFIL